MQPDSKAWLRPSNLPKLAKCSQYRPDADAGEHAARGAKLDAIFRARIAKQNVDTAHLDDSEKEAIRWAVDTAFALAGPHDLESDESALRITCLGLEGTADLLCRAGRWSADLKSGHRHGYLEQQAAYALGFMDAFFEDTWTVHLLYCDLEVVETLHFTRDEALCVVRDALAKSHDSNPPAINEYCGWCARRWDCKARRESVGILPLGGPGAMRLSDATSPMLREFALRAAVVADFAEEARELLKQRLVGGEKVAGCSLVSKRGARKAPPELLERYIEDLGPGEVLAAYGPLSEAKLQDLWTRKLPDQSFPSEEIQEMPGSTYLRVSRPKE
ncbi:MAG TPA: hypothetical protein VGH90_12465 [Chthoniobacteraceae bacterium]|jgi:hypothetical protein